MTIEVPDACILPTAKRPLRVAEFESLFATSLRRTERLDPTTLRLTFDGRPEVEATVRDLAAQEGACCSFFGFGFRHSVEGLVVDVRVPMTHAEVLDSIAAHMAGGQ